METKVIRTEQIQGKRVEIQDLQPEIEEAFALLYTQNQGLAQEIREILNRNIANGRYRSSLLAGYSLQSYVELLIQIHQVESAQVAALQVHKSEAKWQELYTQLAKWAYSYFLRKNFEPGDATMELAQDQASEACIQLLKSPFPYDVSFALWSHRLLLNVCSKYLRSEGRRAKNLPTQAIEDLEEALHTLDAPEKQLETKLFQRALLDGLNQLKDTRAQVIYKHYFEDASFSEIAQEMGKSVAAIHSLHFQALSSLRSCIHQHYS